MADDCHLLTYWKLLPWWSWLFIPDNDLLSNFCTSVSWKTWQFVETFVLTVFVQANTLFGAEVFLDGLTIYNSSLISSTQSFFLHRYVKPLNRVQDELLKRLHKVACIPVLPPSWNHLIPPTWVVFWFQSFI